MHCRLSLIKYADKFGVAKATVKYKTTKQYIRHKAALRQLRQSLCNLFGRPTTPGILRRRLSRLLICTSEILMHERLFSEQNSCSAVIPIPFLDCTVF